ncbi:Enoyl-(Acyl carrier protein) reductase [Ceratobasidium sp. AG-Ba]|nr:Enoyl-(Acyl carrier protein) reductase [Ceratobasidium sp. AG-Ba]
MSNSNTLLKGKKVLVIGIGRSIAAAALSNGASVVIASSSQAKVDAAIELLKKDIAGSEGVTVSGEVLDMNDFATLKKFLTKEAPFDHFVSTAGDPPRGVGANFTADVDIREQMKDSMDLRYWAVLNAANIIHKNNLIRPGGSITMTIGSLQKRPIPGVGFALGAAGAVETATRALAVDMKPLRPFCSSPGLVDTEMVRGFPEAVREPMFEAIRQKSLVGHVGTPDEVAEAYIFAMKCQYLTGQVIVVDGGGVLV